MSSLTKLLDTPLKLISASAALISLVLGVNQVTRVLSEVGERQRQVAELKAVAAEQQKNRDYAAAWATLNEAMKASEQGSYLAKTTGRLDQVRVDARTTQEDLAMAWLRDVSVPSGTTFSSVVDPLAAVLTRAVLEATGSRKADLYAHIGWAYFLKSRDGVAAAKPDDSYRQALDVDAANPFAHAHWGHWIMWQRGPYADASQHFAAALASGRERAWVRQLQLAAMRLIGTEQTERGLLEAVNDMRKNDETVDAGTRRAVFSIYYAAFNSDEYLERLLGELPPAEHVDTIRALFFDADFDRTRVPMRDAMIALLQEKAGMREEALASWRALQPSLGPDGDQRLVRHSAAAMKRLAP